MSSYADRYLAAKQRAAHARTELAVFQQRLEFEMDEFQLTACRALEDGRGVLVAAPTGAGKTVVGEFAVHLALARGQKAFYTTPIKALSNQKFHEFSRAFGADRVGLLTGDTSVNSEADVVVMTTEVLRNMLYADSRTLANLGFVVMDEVHYLADRFRGAVWEEVIIHLPERVQLVSLSATVSNAEEFGAWLDTVRGDTDVVVSEHRPVPLWQHVQVGGRLLDLFLEETTVEEAAERLEGPGRDEPDVNPELLQLARAEHPRGGRRGGRGPGGRSRDRFARRNGGEGYRPGPETRRVSRPQLIRRLDAEGLLPVITFIFSRAGCDGAVKQCVDADIRLTTDREQQTIRARVAEAAATLEAADLNVLGFYEWRDGLLRGVAAHHAGMLPAFKELVEQLFADGLVKAVFATETLALGINMPARSVVLEKLDKFNGESRVDITPGEYTQLTGRAGRRGIDVEGHAVVLWQPGMDPHAVAGLASKRTYPLNSSFRPTYNMSVNLIAQFGADRSRKILESSFAQFQADRSVVGLARRVRAQEESLRGYEESMTCHLGDFTEYFGLRRELKDLERSAERSESRQRRSDAVASLHNLLPGDVVDIPRGRNAGYAVVLATDANRDDPRPSILTLDHQLRRVGAQDLDGPLEPVSRIRIPKQFTGKTPKERRDLASSMRNAIHEHKPPRGTTGRGHTIQFDRGTSASERRIAEVRRALRSHPCHGCSDRESHARWAERWWTLRRETDGLLRQIEGRTNTIAKTFDRVSQVLDSFGYLATRPDGEVRPTEAGEQLRRIYGDRDLLLALSLRDGFLDGLDPAATAGVVTMLVYQAKREDQGIQPVLPSAAMDRAAQTVVRNWSRLTDREEEHHLKPTAEPEFGLVEPMYLWARGATLSTALTGTELAAGDFVRWSKQVIDMLDQLAKIELLGPEVRTQCQRAIALVRRGVVAHSTFED
ncbi:DEAD/DEAH box helicase [Kocuria rosea]|jgi:ATP-dependent RNA helicase HelY|uniref:DEAD/DEAH box helicase n=1 Tax=Kocuria rosea TaxID=1275 RepID=UPI00203B2A56|nr:DEAD/DEAH box helicase [Kocuria rosea]MCM3689363.1 DEAD/DEAH box helicase [Kocuria rosea]HST71341.1 DEAD/DEAH box helicase [Kocuria rosea]